MVVLAVPEVPLSPTSCDPACCYTPVPLRATTADYSTYYGYSTYWVQLDLTADVMWYPNPNPSPNPNPNHRRCSST